MSLILELYQLHLILEANDLLNDSFWSKLSIKTKMALFEIKAGIAIFFERYNGSWFHKFCAHL